MTFLQLVNSVLRRLREDEVSTVSENTYSKLISELINEAKREVEDSHEWVALRDTVQATTASGIFRYYLSGVGNRFKLRSVINDTTDNELDFAESKYLTKLFTSTAETGEPTMYDFSGIDVDDYVLDLYPIPSAVYTININLVRPQLDLALDTEELKVHEYPVLLGAYAKAVAERGDDNGLQYQVAYKAYQDALSDAIQIDSSRIFPTSKDYFPA